MFKMMTKMQKKTSKEIKFNLLKPIFFFYLFKPSKNDSSNDIAHTESLTF